MKKLFALSFALALAVLVSNGSASSFDVQLQTSEISSCPCTPNAVRADVQNLYKSADTIRLSLDLPSGWSGFVQPDVTLGSGDSESIPAYITPPCCSEPGEYSIPLNARSVTTGNEVSMTINIEVMKCYFISLDMDKTYTDICQESGETAMDVRVKNEGKFDDKVSFSTDTPWARVSDSSLAIPAGEERTVSVLIDPPDGLHGLDAIKLTAKSESSYARAVQEIHTNIKDCYGFDAILTPSEKGVPVAAASAAQPSTAQPASQSNASPSITGMAASGLRSWETIIVALIIIVVILILIYLAVKK